MYQSGQTIFDLTSAGVDQRQRPSKNGDARPVGELASGILVEDIAYGFDREMSTILNQLSAAMAELPAGGAAREHIVAAMQAAERAGHLNRQLLAHTGKEGADARPLDLNALIREKVQLLAIDRAPNLTLRLELARSLPTVEGDSEQVQRAIGNLLINAAEAIGTDSGIITVVTSTTTVTGAAAMSNKEAVTDGAAVEDDEEETPPTGELLPAPGDYVTVRISDDGCGMEEETRARMFAPFFSTKGVGRGLGMTAVLGAVRSHGGSIEVTGRPGRGTAVTLFFPVAGDVPETECLTSQPATESSENGTGRPCVLVIDDELDVREAVTDILDIKGLHVLAAADGKSGLHLYREHQDEVDLVLLDLSMPKMGGEETCRRLRELDPGVSVLITSGYDKGGTEAPLARLQPDGFLPKPYDMARLVNAVFELLEKRAAGTA